MKKEYIFPLSRWNLNANNRNKCQNTRIQRTTKKELWSSSTSAHM